MPKKEKDYDLINERLEMARIMCEEHKAKRYNEKGERLWEKDMDEYKKELKKAKEFRENMWDEIIALADGTGMEPAEFYINFLISRQSDYAPVSPKLYEKLNGI